jgi:SAM-dependent methyltransferase
MAPSRQARRLVSRKSLTQLASEWDAISRLRWRQISSGSDVTHNEVLIPAVARLAGDLKGRRVLDAGCGVGDLSALMSRAGATVVGVDMSAESIRLAQATYHDEGSLSFENASVEDYVASHESHGKFDIAVSNMTLMSVPNLPHHLAALRKALKPGGAVVFTIPHPCFWPDYQGYGNEPWFHYNDEIAIEWPYRISTTAETGPPVSHYHRPMSFYISALNAASFDIQVLEEPMPGSGTAKKYPAEWRYPHVLAMKAVARRSVMDG